MIDRDRIRQAVREAYDARQRGDTDAFATYLAPGATYRLTGDTSRLGSFPAGPVDAAKAIGALIGRFRFNTIEPVCVLIDGRHAVVHYRAGVTIIPDGPSFETEIADFLTFDDEGRISNLVEFADTGAIAHMAASGLI